MSDDDTRPQVQERWVFAGVRVEKGNKFVEAWLPPGATTEADTLWYAPKGSGRRWVIGGVYDVTVARGDSRVTRYGDPVWTGEYTDPDARRQFYAADSAARARHAAARDHANAAKADALDAALQPLIDIASKLRTGTDRDAFIAYVMRRLLNPSK